MASRRLDGVDLEVPDAGPYTVRAVERALDVLKAYTYGRSSYTLAELARVSGLGKPTVHRLVRTLEQHRFIERRADGRYVLGSMLSTLGRVATESHELSQLVSPILERVAAQARETTSCTVLEHHEMVTIASVPGMHRLRYDVFPGERVPATMVADGKILLAELEQEEMLRRVAAELTQSERSVSKNWLRQFAAELKRIQREGVAYDLEGELAPGVGCIAVPLRNHRSVVIAALVLSVPSMRLTPSFVSEVTQVMLAAARELFRGQPQPELMS